MKTAFALIATACLAGCATKPPASSAPVVSTEALGQRIESAVGRTEAIDGKAVIATEQVSRARTIAELIDYKAALLEEGR